MKSSNSPIGLVQVIHLRWDKSARGGIGAQNRNSVPTEFLIPAEKLQNRANFNLLIHEMNWGTKNSFSEPCHQRYRRVSPSEEYHYRCVTVTDHPTGLLVSYRWNQSDGGAPERWFINKETGNAESASCEMFVEEEQWIQICTNGRFVDIDTGNWWYEQMTVNVAWFKNEPQGDIFVAREPIRTFRLLADLW